MVRNDATGKVSWGVKEWAAIGAILLSIVTHSIGMMKWAYDVREEFRIFAAETKNESQHTRAELDRLTGELKDIRQRVQWKQNS